MQEFIKKNFFHGIILILCILMFLVTYRKINQSPNISVIRDTTRVITYVIRDTILNTKPVFIEGGRDTILEKSVEYMPSEDYKVLLGQFEDLKQTLLSKSIYKDKIKFDSSEIDITDTIQKNAVVGRKIDFNLKYPVITNTITVTKMAPPKNKFYLGGELGGNKTNLINQAEAAFLFKNKSERIYKLGAQLDFNGQVSYKAGLYIPLNK